MRKFFNYLFGFMLASGIYVSGTCIVWAINYETILSPDNFIESKTTDQIIYEGTKKTVIPNQQLVRYKTNPVGDFLKVTDSYTEELLPDGKHLLKYYGANNFYNSFGTWYETGLDFVSPEIYADRPLSFFEKFGQITYAFETSTESNAGDATLYLQDVNDNSGSAVEILAGSWADPSAMRPWIWFTTPDLSGTIESVTYHMWSNGGVINSPADLTIYLGSRNDVVENQVTWNVYSTGNSWATAGGDFDNTALDVEPLQGTSVWKVWDITTEVTNWNTRYDFILKANTENSINQYNYLFTKENTDPTKRPYWEILYTPSVEPTSTPLPTTTVTYLAGFTDFWDRYNTPISWIGVSFLTLAILLGIYRTAKVVLKYVQHINY